MSGDDDRPAPLSPEWMIRSYEKGIDRRRRDQDRTQSPNIRRRLEREILSLEEAIRHEQKRIRERDPPAGEEARS